MTPITSRRSCPGSTSTTLKRRLIAVAALAGIALAAGACGSTSSGTTTTTAAQTGSTPTTGPGSTTATTSATATTQAAASLSELESNLSAGESATYVATYSVTGTQSGTAVNATFTIARSGTDALFGVVESKGAFEEISVGTKDTVCAQTSGKWTCFNATGSLGATLGASVADFEKDFGQKATLSVIEADAHGATDISTSSTTVDGQSATCYTFHSTIESGVYTVCVTSSGVLASVNASDAQGNTKVELTKFSGSVPSNEFTPPAAVTNI